MGICIELIISDVRPKGCRSVWMMLIADFRNLSYGVSRDEADGGMGLLPSRRTERRSAG